MTPGKEYLWNRNFILLTLSNFLICCSYYALIAALPVYLTNDLHAAKSMVGITLASYIVASVIVRPFTGMALDKLGRKSIFIIALACYAVLFNGYIIAYTVGLVIVNRFLHGLTWGVITTSNSTISIDIVPAKKRGQGIGYFALSTTIGMALGPVVGSYIFQLGGYFALFLGGGLIALISAILAGSITYQKLTPAPMDDIFKLKNLFEFTTLIPSVNILLTMITYGGMMSFIALYGNEIGIAHASGFFLVYAIGVGFSRLSSGKILDQSGPKYVITGCLTLLIIGFPILALVKSALGFYGAAIILGIGNGVIFPTFQVMVNNMVPVSRRGAANSTLYTGVDIGMGLGMVIVGFIGQHFSISAAFLVCSAICAAGLLGFLLVTLKHYNRTVKKLKLLV